jgi:hypothetical protein
VPALTSINVDVLYNQAGPVLFAAFALRNINTGDTLDLSVTGIQPQFQVIKKAVLLSDGANLAAVCQAAGTVVTIPGPNLTAAGGYLSVIGV